MRTPARTAAAVAAVAALLAPVPGASLAAPATPSARPAVAAPAAPTAIPALLRAPAATSPRGPSKVLLTPTVDMATSQVVSWTMPARLKGQKVQYRQPGGAVMTAKASRRPATTKAASGSVAPRYHAILTGLAPGTTYEYRVVTRRGSTGWRTFTTADPAATSTTIIGLGDTQVDNRGVPRRTIRAALAAVPEASLVLQAGDVVDRPYRARQWDDLFAAIGSSGRTRNWVVSIGNHEQCVLITCESNSAEAFRSYFDWPDNGFPGQGQTWFHVDHEGVRIIVLDSFGGRMAEQAAFLDQALATNPNPWSIVLMHAPPFATQPNRANPDVIAEWLPILEARNVDLVLTGHDHAYVRGYYRRANGPVYVSSVSGPKFYEVTDAQWVANRATRVAWAAGTATYQVITISGDKLSYRAVVSAQGPTSTSPFGPGGVLDQFVIDKSEGPKVVL